MTDAAAPQDTAAPEGACKVDKSIPRSIAKQTYFRPDDLTVAGDETTPHGEVFAGTMLDDGRQDLTWGDKHAQIVLGMVMGAEPVANPYAADHVLGAAVDGATKRAMCPVGEPELVYVQHVAGVPGFAIVIENGRQRRRCAGEIDARLAWIVGEFITDELRAEKPAQQRIKLRNTLLEWAKNHPTAQEAAWLTRPFVNAILGSGEDGGGETSGWFDKAWNPLPCLLKVQIIGVDVDVNDPRLLVQSVARKEAQVETPPSLRARQIQRALDKKNAAGEPLLSPKGVAQLLNMGDDALNNSLLILDAIPDVQAAIDSGKLSAKVALIGNPGKRDAAFVVWPKGQPRVLIPPAAQAQVLKGLLEAFPGDERIRGSKAFAVGLKLRKLALGQPEETTTQPPAGAAQDSGGDATGSEDSGAAQDSGQRATATRPVKRGRLVVDRGTVLLMTEHFGRLAPTLPDPEENGLNVAEIERRQRDAISVGAALAMAKFLGGDETALKDYPALAAAFAAMTAEAEPTAPELDPAEVVRELAAAAIDRWEEIPEGERPEAPTVDKALLVAGKEPTDEQVAAATAKLGEMIGAYKGGDRSHDDLGVHLRERLYAA